MKISRVPGVESEQFVEYLYDGQLLVSSETSEQLHSSKGSVFLSTFSDQVRLAHQQGLCVCWIFVCGTWMIKRQLGLSCFGITQI